MATPQASVTTTPGEPASSEGGRRGLSWPEWGILLALVLLIAASVFPAWTAWRRHNRLAMAQSDIRALQTAIARYQREYGTWPVEASSGAVDIRYGGRRPNAGLMRILRSDFAAQNLEAALNPQHMIFIEVERYQKGLSGLDERGEFLDPWGSPYQFALDSNYDGAVQIENSIYGRVSGVGMLIWSLGPDRKSETRDDILSWRREGTGE